MSAKDILLNYHGLVKNRRGPFIIAIKRIDDGVSYYDFNRDTWVKKPFDAYDYSACPNGYCGVFKDLGADIICGLTVKAVLITTAGDIDLKEEDIKEQWRYR
jgi:hypothetical protein